VSEPLRVLVVDHVAGVEAYRRKYELLGEDPDVDVTVLAPETWIENGRVICAPSSLPGCRILTGRAAWRGRENRAFFLTGVARALLRTRPHVVHLLEEPFSVMALQCAVTARLLRPGARTVFYTFDNLREGFRYPYRPGLFYASVQRAVHAMSGAGLASCRDAGRILASRGYRRPVRYVPLGVDPERYRPPGSERAAERERRGLSGFVIGYVGRLLAMKGLSVLLDALPAVPGDWTLLVVGSGPEEHALRRQAERLEIGDRVRIEGGVPHEQVPRLMGLLDVLVLPSLTTSHWKEQFGRVLTEAMACGVPVVGSDSGAIPEVIGDAGRVVPEGDARELGCTLAGLAGDPAERGRLAAAGRRRVLEHFTWERVVAHWRTIWDGLRAGRLESEAAPEWAPRPGRELAEPR
jgi:glycosyltransferase involved in cell wall biosynthesis